MDEFASENKIPAANTHREYMRRVHGMKGRAITRGDLCTSRMGGNSERKKKEPIECTEVSRGHCTSKRALAAKDRTLMLEET